VQLSRFFFLEIEFKDVVHSLDVWHKSKSIKKSLDKVWENIYYYIDLGKCTHLSGSLSGEYLKKCCIFIAFSICMFDTI
jgi:hypothetical protein